MHAILPQHRAISVTPLDEGFSNTVYQITWAERPQLILRLVDKHSQRYGIDRHNELKVWRQASAAGLTADLIWHDGAATASEFLIGHTLSWEVHHSHQTLACLCEAVVALHQLPAVGHHYDVYALIDAWLMQLHQATLEPSVQALLAQVTRIAQTLERVPRPDQLVLCHNDLNPKNVLFDASRPKMWLIDWEAAGMNDPLFELAVMAHIHHFDVQQLDDAYRRIIAVTPYANTWQRIEQYRKAYVLRELVWLLLRHHLGGEQDLDCLQWYHSLFNDPVFNPYF